MLSKIRIYTTSFRFKFHYHFDVWLKLFLFCSGHSFVALSTMYTSYLHKKAELKIVGTARAHPICFMAAFFLFYFLPNGMQNFTKSKNRTEANKKCTEVIVKQTEKEVMDGMKQKKWTETIFQNVILYHCIRKCFVVAKNEGKKEKRHKKCKVLSLVMPPKALWNMRLNVSSRVFCISLFSFTIFT